jgi:UDP-glucose 4-epimerase
MRCLVTGASGFIGSWLVRDLVGQGAEVLAVIRKSSDLWRLQDCIGKIQTVQASLEDIGSAADTIKRFAPDTCFHLAWTGGNSSKSVNDLAQVYANVPGSLELVRISHAAGCRAYIYLGTCVEYGTYSIPVRESDAARPQNLYGAAKNTIMLLSEALCARMDMRFCGVRVFWAYGPMDDENRMIPSVINKFLLGQRPGLTRGEQQWDFLYIQDAVTALAALATSENAAGIFNLGSGKPRPIKDVVNTLRDLIDPAADIGFGDIPYAPNQVMHLEADISKIKTATGWAPSTSLEEGLRKTVESTRERTKWKQTSTTCQ